MHVFREEDMRGPSFSARPILYSAARRLIQPGDALLWRPSRRGIFAWLITRRGPYSHAEMVYHSEGGMHWSAGAIRWVGLRSDSVGNLVRDSGGHWDVFRVVPPVGVDYHPDRAASYMRTLIGQRYGWRDLLRATVVRLPIIRLIVPADVDDLKVGSHAPFCSQGVSRALAAGGLDPVQFCAHRETGPNDLARSPCLVYQFTLSRKEKP